MHHTQNIYLKTIFYSFFLSNTVGAEVNKQLSFGLTQTDNVEIQSNTTNTLNNSHLKRSGASTYLSLQKQDIDFSGGYTLQAYVDYNKSLDNTGNISNTGLSAYKLNTINKNWLSRTGISVNHYDSKPIPVTSYTAVQLENTLGYLHEDNSGVDINIKLRHENHNEDESNQYKIQRSALTANYYFSHKRNAPYWALNAGFSNNNANDEQYDYKSYQLGLESRQWRLGSFYGNVGLQWQKNRYKNIATTSREDEYTIINLNISKKLKKNLVLQASASKGLYQSSSDSSSINFYQLLSRLQWQF